MHVSPPAAVKYQEILAGTESDQGYAVAEAENAIGRDTIGAEAHGMRGHTTVTTSNVMREDVKNGHVRKGLVMKGPGMKGLVRTKYVRTGPARIDHVMTSHARKDHEMMGHAMTGHVKTELEMIGCEMKNLGNWIAVKRAQVIVTDPALNAAGIMTALENIPHTITEHHHGKNVPTHP